MMKIQKIEKEVENTEVYQYEYGTEVYVGLFI